MSSAVRKLYTVADPRLERTYFGLKFPNPVGLAAGFDKDGTLFETMSAFGFGFVEIGTVTPRPQPGNSRPRMFRLTGQQSLINRMGFNNDGMERIAARLARRKPGVIVGGNIGKNKDTAGDDAITDYLLCVDALLPVVDYLVVNVSSPNTPGLREWQSKEDLERLLRSVKNRVKESAHPKPLLVKVAPDLNDQEIGEIAGVIKQVGVEGLIATNTTIDKTGVPAGKEEQGGVSGRLLRDKSNGVIRAFRQALGPEMPIIGVGGIMSAKDALSKLEAGADLLQVYTGFIYEGPSLISKINRQILDESQQSDS